MKCQICQVWIENSAEFIKRNFNLTCFMRRFRDGTDALAQADTVIQQSSVGRGRSHSLASFLAQFIHLRPPVQNFGVAGRGLQEVVGTAA